MDVDETNRSTMSNMNRAVDVESGQPLPQVEQNIFQQSSHPVALFFHFLFRLLAVLVYILGNFLFASSFALSFVVIILLLAFDFWTVKNISGRLLVGLRWWSQMKSDGTEEWIFESRQDGRKPNASDARCFWWSLYLTPFVWGLLAIVCILKFNFTYIPIVLAAISLSSANLMAYNRCDKDAKRKLQGYVTQGIMGRVLGSAGTGILKFVPGLG